ncbi:hypothetical protein ACHQM5_007241 [Ranunculus cassubicifolius]
MAALRRALIGARQTLNSIRSNSLSAAIQSQSPYKFNQNLGPISNFSYKSQSFNVGDLSNEENKRQIVNRLLYRSKQRGYLELDLVLGNWVEEHISSMDEPKIKALVDVLDLVSISNLDLPVCNSQFSISQFELLLLNNNLFIIASRFFFPALGGLLYGYDIGATSGATISLQACFLTYNNSSLSRF